MFARCEQVDDNRIGVAIDAADVSVLLRRWRTLNSGTLTGGGVSNERSIPPAAAAAAATVPRHVRKWWRKLTFPVLRDGRSENSLRKIKNRDRWSMRSELLPVFF